MQLTINGSTIHIKFRRGVSNRRATVCEVQIGTSTVVEVSQPHPQDLYIRSTGRRIALAKALRMTSLGRSARREIWTAYFSQHADLRKNKP